LTERPRATGFTRRSWLLAGLAIPLFRARAAANFALKYDGDNLYPDAPDIHFLTPRVVARLRDSADTQAFISELKIFGGSGPDEPPIRQAHARLVVSYSLWEETFTVAIPGIRTQQGLSVQQAEAWCFENLAVSAAGLDPSKPYRMRFELRSVRRTDLNRVLGDVGISLVNMIDIFSRKAGADEPNWSRELSFRLMDLPRITGRPGRHG
jgi:hypothetical protein